MGILVGLVGFIGSGKGTVGDFMVQNHNFEQDSFAKSLKDAASSMFGWDREMLEGDTDESRFWREQTDRFWSERLEIKNFTPRQALQWLGTEAGRRVFGENLWTSTVERRWIDAGTPNTVIKDCRFSNEIKMIRENGGKVFRVKRGPEPHFYQIMLFHNKGMTDEEDIRQIHQMKTTGSIPHESETAWIGCDIDELILNDAELPDLEKRTTDLVIKLIGGDVQYSLGI